MDFFVWFHLLDLGVLFIFQLWWRKFFLKHIHRIVVLSVLIVFAIQGFLVYLQYRFWEYSPLSKYLLPPYQDIDYYAYYAWKWYLVSYVAALLVAVLFSFAAYWLNRAAGERFFEREELWLLALGIFLSGWPALLFYIPAVLFAGLCLAFYYTLRKWGRAPLYYLWLPTAIFVIIMVQTKIIPSAWVVFLKF